MKNLPKLIAMAMSAAVISLAMAAFAAPSHANDMKMKVLTQKKVNQNAQLRAFSVKVSKLSRRVEQLEAQGKTFDNMSKAQQRRYQNDVNNLYAAVRNDISVASMRAGGGTGTVDCVYACESEYSKCQRSSADWLCRLQAMKCLVKCGVSASISSGTVAQ